MWVLAAGSGTLKYHIPVQFFRAWVEIGERPGEHNLGQRRIGANERSEHCDHANQVVDRIR